MYAKLINSKLQIRSVTAKYVKNGKNINLKKRTTR